MRIFRLTASFFRLSFLFILVLIFVASSRGATVSSDELLGQFIIPAGDVDALIAAINSANQTQDKDSIDLSPGSTYVFEEKDNDIDGPNALPTITTKITINGNGATLIRAPESDPFRILHVFFDFGDLTLNNLTIAGGLADGPEQEGKNGGAIFNKGFLKINNSVIEGNLAQQNGGGVFNKSVMTLSNSVIRNNKAETNGGGIYSENQLTLVRSSISGNEALELGGGIYSEKEVNVDSSAINGNRATGSFGAGGGIYITVQGKVKLVNSTISGNSSEGGVLSSGGGGILIDAGATLTVISSTIADNSSEAGGGIRNLLGTTRLQNSIVAHNSSVIEGPDCLGTFESQGYNLIQDVGDPSGCEIVGDTTGNIIGIDPLLLELGNNLGPTLSHALAPDSPAVDQIPIENCVDSGGGPLEFDQKGIQRPLDGNRDGVSLCDMGSYELSSICGDVNGNGVVETADMEFGLALTVGLPTPPHINLELGELDQNNIPTIIDAIIGLKHIANDQDISDCGPIP